MAPQHHVFARSSPVFAAVLPRPLKRQHDYGYLLILISFLPKGVQGASRMTKRDVVHHVIHDTKTERGQKRILIQ